MSENKEQDLRKLMELMQSQKIIFFDTKVLSDIRHKTTEDIQNLRQFVSAEVFTDGIFSFLSYIMERSYLIHVLNTFSELKIADLRQSDIERIYLLTQYDGERALLIFSEPVEPNVRQVSTDNISIALTSMSIISSFLILLAKSDKTEAVRYLIKEMAKDKTFKNEHQTKDLKSIFIIKLKHAVNELQNTGRGKVDKSKVARLLKYNVNTFSDELKKYKLKYDQVNKIFRNNETGEII